MVMRTELVPYPMIARVAIYGLRRETNHHVGFDVGREPRVLDKTRAAAPMTPEEALRAVAGAGLSSPTGTSHADGCAGESERQAVNPRDSRRER